jgi:hypothetical protein
MRKQPKNKKSILLKIALITGSLLLILTIAFIAAIIIKVPKIEDRSAEKVMRISPEENFYKVGNNWLKKSETGIWEMYVEGNGFERGVAIGKLTKELAEKQEEAFFNQIKILVPSMNYLRFLKYFVAFFNRKLPDYITKEYQDEIYGVSLYASDKYDFIGPKYYRILNYHAAHDIGHALQDKNMTVGCTSFGAWNKKTADGKLIIARNFDFYSGDEFAKNKIICFCKPSTGYQFTYVTWAGFTGVVSGMNNQGITVTINAAKSDIPSSAATPISLLAKEILQYAKNISEAYAIAQKRTTFVAESILIGSVNDNKAAIIEKTPTKTNLYTENRELLVSPNHFQSNLFKNDSNNVKNIRESSSMYRKIRMEELLQKNEPINYLNAAAIMRNQLGWKDKNIGYTNEKGINQLLAHHSVIFKPKDGLMWLSTSPFQLGKYIGYNINNVFAEAQQMNIKHEIYTAATTIPADTFLTSKGYVHYKAYQKSLKLIQYVTDSDIKLILDKKFIEFFIGCNSENFFTYWAIADYYKKIGLFDEAISNYKRSLSKEVATNKEAKVITQLMAACVQEKTNGK